eukprot:CAMPEP_0178995392 /NCGR_PEP_ID=MMETSP0795-20121207/7805_1 /TAXON_ID=88552 /ORGANISM="Amoebophrya sp., Strain Ameob2" /LENGTH=438 /DNA_ID=CAMNT_0020687701 /DNA_START=333 /DNA_END=1649 /DNA_ORIENTATION=-
MSTNHGRKPPRDGFAPIGSFRDPEPDTAENTQRLLRTSIELEKHAPTRQTYYFVAKKENLHTPPNGAHIFGGQILSQALHAASLTLGPGKFAHSLHAYFLGRGDLSVDLSYRVRVVRDGRSFSTRNVDALQRGQVIFSCIVSSQVPEKSVKEYHIGFPPDVLEFCAKVARVTVGELRASPSPGVAPMLPPALSLSPPASPSRKWTGAAAPQTEAGVLFDPAVHLKPYDEEIFAAFLRAVTKGTAAAEGQEQKEIFEDVKKHRDFRGGPTPLDIRPLLLSPDWPAGTQEEPGRLVWFVRTKYPILEEAARDRKKSSEDVVYHQSVLAHMSDTNLALCAFAPLNGYHCRTQRIKNMVSLDHALWFHEPYGDDKWRADEWLLFDCTCLTIGSSRATVRGKVYCWRTKTLVASLAQELLLRFEDGRGPAGAAVEVRGGRAKM